MKPTKIIIAFDTLEQLDQVLAWSYSQGLDWSIPDYREPAREGIRRYAVKTFAVNRSHAILATSRGTLYQGPLDYFENSPRYRGYAFTHISRLLSRDIDCTIPEEK